MNKADLIPSPRAQERFDVTHFRRPDLWDASTLVAACKCHPEEPFETRLTYPGSRPDRRTRLYQAWLRGIYKHMETV